MGSDFELLKQCILDQGAAYKACDRFMKGVDKASNYAELRAVLYKFWPSIIMEHRKAVHALEFLLLKYERFKECFHIMEIFFNEDTNKGRAIYYAKQRSSGFYMLGRFAEGWAFGQSYVNAFDMSKLIGREEAVCYFEQRARGQLFDNCVGRLYDNSSVSSNDKATIFARESGCSFVSGGESVVYAMSFRRGKAFGKSIVKGPSDKNLQLFDDAKYIKMDIR